MTTSVDWLLNKFRAKGVLIDTNLLLLYLVGSFDLELVRNSRFERVVQYNVEDYSILAALLAQFSQTITTPHVLTEVGNLTGQLTMESKEGCFKEFADLFKDFTEVTKASKQLSGRPEFPYFGLTDCAILDAASEYLVITDDLKLYAELGRMGREALNFNHVRAMGWN